jgi:hydroxyacylglutathione hydrolase
MFFKQILANGDNFSYIVADENLGVAAVVDPSFNAAEIGRELEAKNLRLKYIVNTHGHPDHTEGNAELNGKFGGRIVVHSKSETRADLRVDDGDVLEVGRVRMKVIYTPGHSVDSICLLVDGKKLLTGDTLFVGECGRTDMPGGSPKSMYDSLFNKILKLKDTLEVYPGHDYGPRQFSTLGEERRSNYTLQPRSVDEFIRFMRQQ